MIDGVVIGWTALQGRYKDGYTGYKDVQGRGTRTGTPHLPPNVQGRGHRTFLQIQGRYTRTGTPHLPHAQSAGAGIRHQGRYIICTAHEQGPNTRGRHLIRDASTCWGQLLGYWIKSFLSCLFASSRGEVGGLNGESLAPLELRSAGYRLSRGCPSLACSAAHIESPPVHAAAAFIYRLRFACHMIE